MTCSKTLGISLSLGGWGCVGKRPTDLSTIPTPLESGEAWVLGTGDCKTREILHFPPFRLRSLTEGTGYKRPGLGLFDGPCTLTGSEGI